MGATEPQTPSAQCTLLPLSSPAGVNNPILSFSVATLLLALLYLPRFLLRFVLSPVTISAVALLTALLRYGANSNLPSCAVQLSTHPPPEEELVTIAFPETYPKSVTHLFPHTVNHPDTRNDVFHPGDYESHHAQRGEKHLSEISRTHVEGAAHYLLQTPPFRQNFFDRCRGDPLEVIYEEYGEGEENGTFDVEMEDVHIHLTHQPRHPTGEWSLETDYPSAGFCFTASNDDSSSDSQGDSSPLIAWLDFPHDQCFQWELGDPDEEGMIEIPLEDDNLIELDLSVFR